MWDFIKNNWGKILFLIVGIVMGILGNMYANKLSEDRIIKTLTAEIEALKEKQKSGTLTAEEKRKINQLQAELKLKIGVCSDCTDPFSKLNCPNCKDILT